MSKSAAIRSSIYKLIDESKSRQIQKLPAERELCTKMGVSRATLARILSEVEREGLIDRRQGSGTYILNRAQPSGTCFAVLLRGVIHKSRPHFDTITHGLSEHAAALNVHLQIFEGIQRQFEADPEHNRLCKSIDAGLVDGLIIISRMPLDVIARLYRRLPLVTVNNVVNPMEVTTVTCDYFRAGFLAASHLLARGHRHMTYVTNSMSHAESVENFSGFRSALEAHGLPCGEAALLVAGDNADTIGNRVEAHLARYPQTGFFVRFDILAAQLIRLLNRSGRQVPRDASVIGMGNYMGGYSSSVALTTVDSRLGDMGRKALDLLVESRTGDALHGGLHLLEPKLIERESVCPPSH